VTTADVISSKEPVWTEGHPGHRVAEPDRNVAVGERVAAGEDAGRRVFGLRHPFRDVAELEAQGRRMERAVAAQEQAHAELLLDPLHMLRDRRLGDAEQSSGGGIGAGSGDGVHGADAGG
jgi:hypothetical protein